MSERKATIYDLYRMCKSGSCNVCALDDTCPILIAPDKINVEETNNIIVNWCEEHPVKTRQDKLLEAFPHIIMEVGVVDVCPKSFPNSPLKKCGYGKCYECKKEFWLGEYKEDNDED